MDILTALQANLLSPAVLFFLPGLIAVDKISIRPELPRGERM